MVNAYRPATLAEAVEIRAQTGAVPLAGGTDLMVRHKNPVPGATPRFEAPVMFVGHLEELRGIREDGEFLRIGAATPLYEIENFHAAPEILRAAISNMAARNIRHIATIGGNICNASPAGDTLVPLYALDALLVVVSPAGEKQVPIEEFIIGPGQTVLGQDELVAAVLVPRAGFDVWYYKKVGTRKAMALSKVSFGGLARIANGAVPDIRLAFGAVAPTVVRSREIEAQIKGQTLPQLRKENDAWAEKYSPLIRPIDDQRSTAEYRKKVALRLLSYFLGEVIAASE